MRTSVGLDSGYHRRIGRCFQRQRGDRKYRRCRDRELDGQHRRRGRLQRGRRLRDADQYESGHYRLCRRRGDGCERQLLALRRNLGNVRFRVSLLAGLTGTGEVASGTSNSSYGGLFFDTAGNLVSVDAFAGMLYVYHGCKPNCTLAGGPYSLHGASFYGNLNRAGNRMALGDWGSGEVDVYTYSPPTPSGAAPATSTALTRDPMALRRAT